MSQQPSAIRSRTISLASAALIWPGGQSKDCIISHAPVRRYLPFRPPTHRSWPLRYRDYARSANDNGRTFLTPSADGTCEARAITPSFLLKRKTSTYSTRYPGMTGIFRADPLSPKADSDINKDRHQAFQLLQLER